MNKLEKTLSALADGTQSYANLMTALEDIITTQNSREVLELLKKAVDSGTLPKQDYLTLFERVNELAGISDSETRLNFADLNKRLLDVSDATVLQVKNEELEPREKSTIGVGSVLNRRFILDEVIGHGSMGVIYRAHDIRKEEAQDKDPYVAIKVLSEGFKSHPDAFISLQRETKKAQKLAHPSIVTVYDFDRDGDTVFMTMEWLEGESLSDVIKHKAPLSHQEAFLIIQGMVNGLTYAHKKGIIHLDLKPGNVFVTRDGVVKILDFGISQAALLPGQTATEDTLFNPRLSIKAMTLSYASCEIIEEVPPDPRDDIYALGCITYELLVGRHPFNKTVSTVARDAGLKPKKAQELSHREWSALDRALKFERAERTPTADQFMIDLEVGGRSKNTVISRRAFVSASIIVITVFASFYIADLVEERTVQDEKIAELTLKAKQEYVAGKRTETGENNALSTYKKILKLDPDNKGAKQELAILGEQLVENARRYADNRNWQKSLENIDSGIEILPENEELVLLRKEVLSKKAQFDRQTAEDKAISELQAKADNTIEKSPLSLQDISSAYNSYTDVLNIDPDNVKAKIGIKSLKSYQVGIIEQNISQKNWQKSLDYLEPLVARFPDDKHFVALYEQVKLAKTLELAEKQKEIERSRLEAVYLAKKESKSVNRETEQDTQEFVEFQASMKKRGVKNEQAWKEQELKWLLSKAELHLNERRYTKPPKQNAYETYREVLARYPGNAQAIKGIDMISDRIVMSANNHFENGDWEQCISEIETGLKIIPESKDLLTLRAQVERKIAGGGLKKKKKTPYFPGW